MNYKAKNINIYSLDEKQPDNNTAVMAINTVGALGLIFYSENKWYGMGIMQDSKWFSSKVNNSVLKHYEINTPCHSLRWIEFINLTNP